MWPLIADSPAMSKIAGFASHNATLFCNNCYIPYSDINEVDIKTYQTRTKAAHKTHSEAWLAAPSAAVQQKLVKKNGVRATPFSQLPYWQPVKFTTIDIMHCLALGILKDFSTTFLCSPIAAKELEKQKAALAYSGTHDLPPENLKPYPAPGNRHEHSI